MTRRSRSECGPCCHVSSSGPCHRKATATPSRDGAEGFALPFCRDHLGSVAPLFQKLIVAAVADARPVYRSVIWATVRAAQLVGDYMPERADRVLGDLLDPVFGKRRDDLGKVLEALAELSSEVGPKHPIVCRWRGAYRRARAIVQPAPISPEIGAPGAQNSPPQRDAAQPPHGPGGGHKAR